MTLRYIAWDENNMIIDIIEFVPVFRKDKLLVSWQQKIVNDIIKKAYDTNGRVSIEFVRDEKTGLPL